MTTCPECGDDVPGGIPAQGGSSRVYCTQRCQARASYRRWLERQKVARECCWCHAEFLTHHTRQHLHCSDACKGECRKVYLRLKARKHAQDRRYQAYGTTREAIADMQARQGDRCAICGSLPTDDSQRNCSREVLAVDHDHQTGAVRGLLCCYCNWLLGYADDSTDLLAQAIRYLEGATDGDHRSRPAPVRTAAG